MGELGCAQEMEPVGFLRNLGDANEPDHNANFFESARLPLRALIQLDRGRPRG